jgi:hypothetical protein
MKKFDPFSSILESAEDDLESAKCKKKNNLTIAFVTGNKTFQIKEQDTLGDKMKHQLFDVRNKIKKKVKGPWKIFSIYEK